MSEENKELNEQIDEALETAVADVAIPEEVVEEVTEAEEEAIAEEVTEEAEAVAKEEKEEVAEVAEEVEEVKTETVEEIIDERDYKAELEELEKQLAVIKEAEVERGLKTDVENAHKIAARDIDVFNQKLAVSLEGKFNEFGLDVNKSVAEIAQEDPSKGQIAKQLVEAAQRLQNDFIAQARANISESVNKLVFTKAEKAFDIYELSDAEAEIAAQTFVNIFRHTGLQNLEDDLIQKVELAVAHGKMLAAKAVGNVEKVVEAVKEIKEVEAKIEEKAAEPEICPEVAEVAGSEEVIPTEEPKADILAEYSEGIDNTPVGAKGSMTPAEAIEKLSTISEPRARVAFYKEHQALIAKGMREL